jgi:hypothetical protein
VLRDGAFGELFVDGHRPAEGRHIFASIQSLAQISLDDIAPDAFDVVVVDEFHHAAASTYERLLTRLRPRILLGLTATPERTDGQSVLKWFDGRIAVELRLWDALERGLLCPFQYFGLHDDTDLSRVQWSRRGYDVAALENVYTSNQGRVSLIIKAIWDKIANPRAMRALGFCVSVAHARFMAGEFSRQGLPSTAVSAETSSAERDGALRDLKDGKINVLFCVDLFNEGSIYLRWTLCSSCARRRAPWSFFNNSAEDYGGPIANRVSQSWTSLEERIAVSALICGSVHWWAATARSSSAKFETASHDSLLDVRSNSTGLLPRSLWITSRAALAPALLIFLGSYGLSLMPSGTLELIKIRSGSLISCAMPRLRLMICTGRQVGPGRAFDARLACLAFLKARMKIDCREQFRVCFIWMIQSACHCTGAQ